MDGERRELVTCHRRKEAFPWGNEDTEELIEILGKYNVKATFFLVGQWVDKYPESVKALADAGHEIENHSNTHPHLTQCGSETIIEELEGCNEKIKKITGLDLREFEDAIVFKVALMVKKYLSANPVKF